MAEEFGHQSGNIRFMSLEDCDGCGAQKIDCRKVAQMQSDELESGFSSSGGYHGVLDQGDVEHLGSVQDQYVLRYMAVWMDESQGEEKEQSRRNARCLA